MTPICPFPTGRVEWYIKKTDLQEQVCFYIILRMKKSEQDMYLSLPQASLQATKLVFLKTQAVKLQ